MKIVGDAIKLNPFDRMQALYEVRNSPRSVAVSEFCSFASAAEPFYFER